MIHDVKIKEFADITSPQGGVQHMVRADEHEFFSRFGEIYFSITNPGVVKAWHRQEEQTNLLSCVSGSLLLVLYDAREDSPTHGETMEIHFGDGARKLVKIPPKVMYGWKNTGTAPAILANCASHIHDPKKSMKIDPASGEIPYTW